MLPQGWRGGGCASKDTLAVGICVNCFVPASGRIPEVPEEDDSGGSTSIYQKFDTSSAATMLVGESVVIFVVNMLKNRDSCTDVTQLQEHSAWTDRRLAAVQVLKINEPELRGLKMRPRTHNSVLLVM